ncbi:MAG: T9SS type A sorting domain-containing protein [Ignavibacteria bacterium]|nr:T9SS type A sorting domain-containing protein [Ignavibacteria bacterium]
MKGWVSIALGLIVAIALTSAQVQADLPWYVVGSGGQHGAVSQQRVLSGTIGQVVVGVSVNTVSEEVSQGFWLPINFAVSVEDDSPIDYSGSLSNYPNPFSGTTTIRFGTPVEGALMVRVFDLVGNLVRTINADVSLAGAPEIPFDGLDSYGAPLGNGTYLYEVTGQTIDGHRLRSVQRMTILR